MTSQPSPLWVYASERANSLRLWGGRGAASVLCWWPSGACNASIGKFRRLAGEEMMRSPGNSVEPCVS